MAENTALRQRRIEAGLTQQQLAQKLDVTPAAVGMWERGERCPRWQVGRKLAEALAIPFSAIYPAREDS